MEVLTLIISIISLFLSLGACFLLKSVLHYSIEAKIEVEAMRKSTHVIQYVDPTIDKENEKYKADLQEKANKFDDLADKTVPNYQEDKNLFGF